MAGIDLKALTSYSACVAKELDIIKLYNEISKRDTSACVDADATEDGAGLSQEQETNANFAQAVTSVRQGEDAALMMI